MHHRKQRHFLSHTFEHLFGVVAVLVIAVTLGALAKSLDVPSSSLLALTSGDTSSSSTLTNTTGSLMPVTFSVDRMGIECSNGMALAKYRFVITPDNGGYVAVTTPTGSDYVSGDNGRGFDRFYNIGNYTWQAGPRSGYTGSNFGMFYVENVCATATSGTSGGSTTSTTTTTSTSGSPPPPPPTSSTALISVSFSAQPGLTPTCDAKGIAHTPVFLAITKTTGGEFLLSSNTGMNNAHYGFGEYYLLNGSYSWSAVVFSGFQGDGSLAGSFVIDSHCAAPTATTISGTTNTTTTPLPTTTTTASATTDIAPTTLNTTSVLAPLPRPQLHLFLDNSPVAPERVFNKEEVELRITTAIAEDVEIYTTVGILQSKLFAHAVKDDLLSRPGIDVWSYVLLMGFFPEGGTKIHVRVKHTDGRETLSERMSISVRHPIPITQGTSATGMTPVRPISGSAIGSNTVDTTVRVSTRERAAILDRVSNPSSCANADECRIYCQSLPGVNDLCVAFVQEQFVPTRNAGESLTDSIPDERLLDILPGGVKHSTELPEFVSRPEELKQYCGSATNAALCTKILIDNNLATRDVLEAKKEKIVLADAEHKEVFTNRTGARAYLDTDGDSVTDYDEVNIYHTDPRNTDSDKDSFTDGTEILARTNPLGGVGALPPVSGTTSIASASTTSISPSGESVAFYNPMITGVTEPKLLAVKNVEVAVLEKDSKGTSVAKKLKIAGTAQPNAFVTLYIFSEPIVVTVKADGAGAWTYLLDKELPDGSHQVYSAITDAGGRILAKSEPLPFIKSAAAVTLGTPTLAAPATRPGFFTGASLYAMIAILVGILGLALSIIGFIVRQRNAADSIDLPGI